MINKPTLDMGWGSIIQLFGLIALIYSVPVTILAEALIIKLLLNLSFWRSLKNAILMNLVTGVLGIITFIVILPPVVGETIRAMEANVPFPPARESILFVLISMFGIPCVISIIVEGLILGWLEEESALKTVWSISILGNSLSYLGLLLIGIYGFF